MSDEDSSEQSEEDSRTLDLREGLKISLAHLSDNNDQAAYTIENYIAALEATTTVVDLGVSFAFYKPTPENNRRVVEPLCRCIANLRRQNEHHPLRKLELWNANLDQENGTLDAFEQFLHAAKQCGLEYARWYEVFYVPVKFLVEFCRNNNNIKFLGIDYVLFSSGGRGTAVNLPPNDGPLDPSVHLVLHELVLNGVSFENSVAATDFNNFVSHMNVTIFVLGSVTAWIDDDDDDDDDGDIAVTKCIVSLFKMPSVRQLTLSEYCRLDHFESALEAGTTSLISLDVIIDWDEDDATARLESLANMIRRAVRLNSLWIDNDFYRRQISLTPQFFDAMEACATITAIRVNNYARRDFSPRDVQHLRRIAARNKKLALFVAGPSTYPTYKLLTLMRQFDNSPTGRYMLARRLPESFSFEKGDSLFPPTKPGRKRAPTPNPMRQLRKRKNVSYKV